MFDHVNEKNFMRISHLESTRHPRLGRARRANRCRPLTIAQFDRSAALLTCALCQLLGELNEAMGFRIGIAIEMVANVKTEVAGFFLDLRHDHRWHRAGFHLTGDFNAQAINDVEPTVAALEAQSTELKPGVLKYHP